MFTMITLVCSLVLFYKNNNVFRSICMIELEVSITSQKPYSTPSGFCDSPFCLVHIAIEHILGIMEV